MAWQETDPVNERVKFIAAQQSGLYTMSEVCARFGISRKTGYKWVGRYVAEGVDGLKERSHVPKHCPHRMSAEVEAALLDAREAHRTWGPRKLVPWLKRQRPELELPAPSTVGDLLGRKGLVERRRRRRGDAHPGTAALETAAPNEVWTVDFKGEFRTQDGRYCYPLTVVDAHTRFLLGCDSLHSTSTAGVIPCFERMFREFGLPEAIRSDNGTPFASTAICGLSRLNVWWLKLGLVHQRIQPGKPQQNGAHERMHRTLKAETTRPPERNAQAQQVRFDEFRREFNEERPHEAQGSGAACLALQRVGARDAGRVPVPEYPGHYETRGVRRTGEFRFRGHAIFLSEVLAGERIGLEEVEDGIWSIYFFDRLLARLDERTRKLYG